MDPDFSRDKGAEHLSAQVERLIAIFSFLVSLGINLALLVLIKRL